MYKTKTKTIIPERSKPMYYTAGEIASFFLSLDKDNKLFKNNTEARQRLNNYLYSAQVNYIAKQGIPLFSDKIHAAKNGCTIQYIEENYIKMLTKKEKIKLKPEDEDFLERLYKQFEYATDENIKEVAQSDPAWQQYYYNHNEDGKPLNIIGNTIVYQKCYRGSVQALYY